MAITEVEVKLSSDSFGGANAIPTTNDGGSAAIVERDATTTSSKSTITVKPSDPLIWYHGRWDKEPGTWWGGSGFKLHVKDLSSLTLNVGSAHTTQPYALTGVSVDYEPFRTVNVSAGVNVIPLGLDSSKKHSSTTVVRIAVEGWQNNRIELDSIELNKEAKLLPYKPSKLAFQVIGDSLSAGQYNTFGTLSSWGFQTAQAFKAESNINAQPGACLTDQLCWGNYHGVSYQYFKTEDTGYYYTTDHNYTTDWNFEREYDPTHIFIHIGANDGHFEITGDAFVQTYLTFLGRLRKLYPKQPIFVFTSWGWPGSDGTVGGYWFTGKYEEIVQKRKAAGDKNIYLVDTTGWISWDDVFPDNQHPNDAGHIHVAEKLTAYLEKWGLQPEKEWKTLPKN